MKTLYLVRHAKAKMAGTFDDDIDRTLSDAGADDALQIGGYLGSDGRFVDKILCSPARRTRQTLDAISQTFSPAPEFELIEDLYLASDDQIVDIVRKYAGDVGHLLVICHNPGLENLIRRITNRGENLELITFPAGAVITIKVENWDIFMPESAALSDFWVP